MEELKQALEELTVAMENEERLLADYEASISCTIRQQKKVKQLTELL